MTTTLREKLPVAEALAGLLQRRPAAAAHRLRRQRGRARRTRRTGWTCATERGLSYLLTAPGDLGFARAYVSGDLVVEGVHPGDPYDAAACC